MIEKHLPEIEQLRLAIAELSTLNEIAIAIGASMSVENITKVILDKSIKHIGASQGAVFLRTSKKDESEPLKTFVRRIGTTRPEMPFHFNMNLTGWMNKHKRLLVVNSPETENPLTRLSLKSLGIKSLIASPLLTRNDMIGVIAFFNKESDGGFTYRDSRFLEILSTQCAQVIEAARLYEEEKKLTALREELQIARSIQQGFLPHEDNFGGGSLIYGVNKPAQEVSGDFFDVFWLDNQRVFVSVGDVVGKGIPAALFMSNAIAVERAHLTNRETFSITSLAYNLNQLLYQFNKPGQFITAFFGVFDRSKMTLEYVNAGHYPPVIVRDGQIVAYDHTAEIVLGVVKDSQYRRTTQKLLPGSTVCIFTDGVTEMHNESSEEYGDRRLISFLRRTSSEPARIICDKLVEELTQFRGSAEQSDDITVVVLKT
ncbi:MAG: PP2C family protein-serine/threonine phosphatase [Candidatus Zixiibacteriota bacterium]